MDSIGLAFKWINDIFEFFKSFLPHRQIIQPCESVVKFVWGRPRLYHFEGRGGIVWWIPLVSDIYCAPVKKRSLDLPEQNLTTCETEDEDAIEFFVDGFVVYDIFNLELACCNCFDYNGYVSCLAQAAIKDALWGKTWSEVYESNTPELYKQLVDQLNIETTNIGINVRSVRLQSLSRTRMLSIRGGGAAGWAHDDEETAEE